MVEEYDVLIIGGGPAGRVLVHELNAGRYKGRVALIKNEPVNVNRCAVPFGIDGKSSIEKYLISNSLVSNFGAELIIDEVVEHDPKKHTVTTKSERLYGYRHLLLATGAKPYQPSILGVDSENVVSVRTITDLENLRTLVKTASKAVVIGAGFIGVETAAVLSKIGLKVTLVSKYQYAMQSTFEPDLAPQIHQDLISNGVEVVQGAKAIAFTKTGNKSTSVVLDNGIELVADFFILALGIVPNVDLAQRSGIGVSAFGIITDQFLRTTYQSVYAAGDCAEKKSFLSGKPIKGEFGTNAVFMGKAVAANILGFRKPFPGVINANCATAFGISFGSVGLWENQAREHGFEPLVGFSQVLDKYPMTDNASEMTAKLVFDRSTTRLIGGSVVRKGGCVAGNIDFLSLAIQKKVTLEELIDHQYSTHPELSAKPSDNLYLFAAKDALSHVK